jgi:hypothetical protein
MDEFDTDIILKIVNLNSASLEPDFKNKIEIELSK